MNGLWNRVPGTVVALLVTVAAGAQPVTDWPQWRGPNRDGTAASFSPPEAWPAALELRWRVGAGAGYATPVVVGDRVYLFAREGSEEVMRALDAASGDEVWRTAYPAPFSFQPAAEPHGPGPKATPTFADGKLFTLGIGGVVSALDAETGEILWQIPEPPIVPLYGTAASPLVDGDRVIVNVGGDGDGAIRAFDTETGEVVWSWDGDGPSYASPFMTTIDGVRQVVTLTQGNVVGVAADDGALLWGRPYTTSFTQNIITPIVAGSRVVVSGTQNGVAAFRVGRTDGNWTTEEAWENRDAAFYMTNPLLVDGMLFGLSERNSGQFVLIDAEDGSMLWEGSPRQAENAAISRAGDWVVVLEEDGELLVGRLSMEGGFDEVQRYTVADAATWSQPALTGNRIYVKDVSGLSLWTVD
jgi:outer membrane protein assembly factor BamB